MTRKIVLVAVFLLVASGLGSAQQKSKFKGYITARPDEQTLQILDDLIQLSPATQFEIENAAGGKRLAPQDLTLGMLIEVEGTWTGKHQFSAKKVTCDWDQFDREIRERAYLEREPTPSDKDSSGLLQRLRLDGEALLLNEATRRSWPAGVQPASEKVPGERALLGHQVRYEGVRRPDGAIAAREVEFGPPPPASAFEIPDDIEVTRAQDPQTKIDILEFRKKKKVLGRQKLFPVKQVQEYVSQLGNKLIPVASLQAPTPALEFRFFVVEDSSINASALPDGTILVHTGLLGAMDNEAQLAYVLSHEIAHVLQAHYWRHVHETRAKRVWITIAAIAASAYIGDLGLFLGRLGLEAVVNGYGRRLENQADRLGLDYIIEQGYDPHQALRMFRVMIERYGSRTSSKIWSDHDSSLLRGSFLVVQMARRYPLEQFSNAVADTQAYRAMREAMGPVKVM